MNIVSMVVDDQRLLVESGVETFHGTPNERSQIVPCEEGSSRTIRIAGDHTYFELALLSVGVFPVQNGHQLPNEFITS